MKAHITKYTVHIHTQTANVKWGPVKPPEAVNSEPSTACLWDSFVAAVFKYRRKFAAVSSDPVPTYGFGL